MLSKVKKAGVDTYEYLTSIELKDVSTPVKQAHAFFLFVLAFMTIIGCCASTTVVVRMARDSNIAMNALSIKHKYHRNMQLFMLVKEKMAVERAHDRAFNGHSDSSPTASRSLTESDPESSFASSCSSAD